MNRRNLVAVALLLPLAGTARAGISAEDARALGTTLTEVGAERTGNADGTIPAYEGGLTRPPPSFRPGSGTRPDPFADERPLFSIDAGTVERCEVPTDGRASEAGVVRALRAVSPNRVVSTSPSHPPRGLPT